MNTHFDPVYGQNEYHDASVHYSFPPMWDICNSLKIFIRFKGSKSHEYFKLSNVSVFVVSFGRNF